MDDNLDLEFNSENAGLPIDRRCGDCGKLYSKHYHEDDVYCYKNTTDVFSSYPSHAQLCIFMSTYHNDVYLDMVSKWKKYSGNED